MHLNKSKRIGKVLYLVEGDVDEVVLLEHIFNSLLGYCTVSFDKRNENIKCLIAPNDPYSKVFIVPMQHSAITKIQSSTDYLDYIYQTLKVYGLEKDECAKYLVFDRDRDSNPLSKYKELISIFKNSLDNDQEINGLLLISYPCIQAFICECFGDETNVSSSNMMKDYSKIYDIKEITEQKLICSAKHLLKISNRVMNSVSFDINNLDNMQKLSSLIFEFEEDHFSNERCYLTLSTILFSFIDLGIIDIEDKE